MSRVTIRTAATTLTFFMKTSSTRGAEPRSCTSAEAGQTIAPPRGPVKPLPVLPWRPARTPHAPEDRLHPHRGRPLLPRIARRGHPGRGPRLRLGVDGGAPRRHQSLLAVAANRAGRLRHPHVAPDAGHR